MILIDRGMYETAGGVGEFHLKYAGGNRARRKGGVSIRDRVIISPSIDKVGRKYVC